MVCENCGTEVKEGSTFCPRCGKTINSSDGVLPNGELKNEDNTSDLMKVIIKTKINYYMQQFELIKNGNKGRTNWASFFFGFIHAGYRNMCREWISAVKIPLIAELVLMILAGITMFVHPMAGMIFYGLEAVVAIWLMVAQFLFAGKFNRVYMKHVQEKVSCKNEKPDPSVGRAVLSYVIMMVVYAVVMAILSAAMVAGINYQMQQELKDYTEESVIEEDSNDIDVDSSEDEAYTVESEEPDISSEESAFDATEYDWEGYYECLSENTSAGLYIYGQDESGIMFSLEVDDAEENVLVDLRDCVAYWTDNRTVVYQDDSMNIVFSVAFNEDGTLTVVEEANSLGISGGYQRSEEY